MIFVPGRTYIRIRSPRIGSGGPVRRAVSPKPCLRTVRTGFVPGLICACGVEVRSFFRGAPLRGNRGGTTDAMGPTQNWHGPWESDCLIKTKHCDGLQEMLTQCDFCPVL
ncbi:hypothetical protein NPIL_94441 [Nephila pilipes]|uniref:Uncharacterized protein n=1 Tax=Nephila pilipes TaxID=299642 RepID=A0A8X6NH50_NEPPI|nr:hypothetical protein NPIL_94441 [Nephila pilipes]